MFEPITFPKAIFELPSSRACKLTKSSGAEVEKETIVIPTTKVEIRIFKASATDPFINNSPQKKEQK